LISENPEPPGTRSGSFLLAVASLCAVWPLVRPPVTPEGAGVSRITGPRPRGADWPRSGPTEGRFRSRPRGSSSAKSPGPRPATATPPGSPPAVPAGPALDLHNQYGPAPPDLTPAARFFAGGVGVGWSSGARAVRVTKFRALARGCHATLVAVEEAIPWGFSPSLLTQRSILSIIEA